MIEDKVLAAITSHAERAFPQESCGLVLDNNGLLHYLPCENKSHQPEQSFLIDPVIYAQCADRVKMIVHSHPNRSAQPSQADMASCERSGVPYFILSYPAGAIQCYYPKGYVPEFEGRPFVYGVFDCFGLVKDWYKSQLLIDLPDRERPPYGWWLNPENTSCIISDYQRWGFHKTDDLKRGDVIVMQLAGQLPNHVSVYLGEGVMLHQTLNNISRQEQYGNYWRKNTIAYLRHNEND